MDELIQDLLIVAIDGRESEAIRTEAMKTLQSLRDEEIKVKDKQLSRDAIDRLVFNQIFTVPDIGSEIGTFYSAGSISSYIYRVTDYEISRYRIKKMLKTIHLQISADAAYFLKIRNG